MNPGAASWGIPRQTLARWVIQYGEQLKAHARSVAGRGVACFYGQRKIAEQQAARLIAAPRALLLARRMPEHQRRTVLLQYDSGTREELDVTSDVGAYNALFRFGHPEHRCIGRWFSEEVVPTLHDQHREADVSPKRAFMSWANQRIGVVKWQGELWIARRDLPILIAAHDEPALRDGPSWRNMPYGDW